MLASLPQNRILSTPAIVRQQHRTLAHTHAHKSWTTCDFIITSIFFFFLETPQNCFSRPAHKLTLLCYKYVNFKAIWQILCDVQSFLHFRLN